MCWKSRNATVACRTMASSTPDGSVNYDMTDSNSRGWIVCGEQNEAQSNVSSVTSLHAAREWARSTETEGSLLGITCNVAGDPGIDTEASAAAVAIQQEMQQQEVIEKPEKLGGGTGPGGTWSHRDFVKNPKKVKPPSARRQNSTFEVTLDTRISWSERVHSFKRKVPSDNRKLPSNMKGINALQLDFVHSESHPNLEEFWLATLAELKKTTFPPRRSEASKVEPEDVKSDSCSSVASSVAARK